MRREVHAQTSTHAAYTTRKIHGIAGSDRRSFEQFTVEALQVAISVQSRKRVCELHTNHARHVVIIMTLNTI